MKLRVENLARIKEAEVEIKNLTLFVGQNSTHKSYMAHVVYELYKEISSLKGNYGATTRFSSVMAKQILQNYDEEIEYLLSFKRELSEEAEEQLIDVDEWQTEIYTILTIHIDNKDKRVIDFVSNLYTLLFSALAKKINSSFNNNSKVLENLYIEDIVQRLNKIQLLFPMPLEYYHKETDEEEIKYRITSALINDLVDSVQKKLNDYRIPHYFPASRTGFVLTLDEIYAGIFRDKFRGQASATRLGEPTIDFIQAFADIKTGKTTKKMIPLAFRKNSKVIENLISFLEKNIIKGRIKEVRNDQDYANYYLDVDGIELDLHLASSATLETLPFIVFLNNVEDISKTFFVIEEPEAHLHPKAQIEMAKFIVMLSNAGAKVLVTTHSDYILSEINNCIKLYSLDKTDTFSISHNDISAYLFKNMEDKTVVNSLDIDKFGVSNDNFDEVLDELLEKSSQLSEEILEND